MNESIGQLMGTRPDNVLALLLLFWGAPGLGGGLRRLLKMAPGANCRLIDGALGLNLLGLLALLLFPLLSSASPYLVGGLLVTAGSFYWARAGRGISAAALKRYAVENLPALLLLAFWGTYLLGSALIPPYSWDEQTYQLALPVQWLAAGSAAAAADNPYSAFPSLPQFVFSVAIHLGGLGTARLLCWGLYLLVFWVLYDELRRIVPKAAALLLTAVFAVSPLTLVMMRTVYIEIFILVNLLAALRLRRLRPERESGRVAVLFGLLAGFTAAIKLTALGGAAAILLAALPEKRSAWLRGAATVFSVALAAGGLFYLRPWLDLGNPVYPFLTGLFAPGDAGMALLEQFHYDLGSAHYGLKFPLAILAGWLTAAFEQQIYEGIVLGWQFPLLILLGATGLYLSIWKQGEKRDPVYGTMLLVLYLYWSCSSQQTRFLLPGFLLALFFAAQGLAAWPEEKSRRFWLAVLLIGAAVSVNGSFLLHFKSAWGYLGLARAEPARMVAAGSRDLPYMNMLAYVKEQTPPAARMLLIFERRSLYVPRRTFHGSPGFQCDLYRTPPDDPEELYALLLARAVDYLIVSDPRDGLDYLPAYDELNQRFDALLVGLVQAGRLLPLPVPDSGNHSLLQVVRPTD